MIFNDLLSLPVIYVAQDQASPQFCKRLLFLSERTMRSGHRHTSFFFDWECCVAHHFSFRIEGGFLYIAIKDTSFFAFLQGIYGDGLKMKGDGNTTVFLTAKHAKKSTKVAKKYGLILSLCVLCATLAFPA